MLITINQICSEYNIEMNLPQDIDLNNVIEIKREIKRIYTLVYKLSKFEEDKLKTDKITDCIQQRCIDYDTNPSKMINSILERYKRKIVIDRLFVQENGTNKIILDPTTIKEKVVSHFQNAAVPICPPRSL